MATYKEIVERANVALDQAIARCEAREREILRQKAAALDGIPHARDAVTKHTVALLKASDDLDNARRKAGTDLATAEAQAEGARQQRRSTPLTGRCSVQGHDRTRQSQPRELLGMPPSTPPKRPYAPHFKTTRWPPLWLQPSIDNWCRRPPIASVTNRLFSTRCATISHAALPSQ